MEHDEPRFATESFVEEGYSVKAAVYTKYGPPEVLQVKEIEKPTPKDDQILVRVLATSVTSGDVRLRKADPFIVRFFMGLFRPRKPVLGADLAGEVEAVGKEVRRFKSGDQVFGLGVRTYAEYTCLKEDGPRVIKPLSVSFEEAAAIPLVFLTAWQMIVENAKVRPGETVVVLGAGSGVGTAAIQIAKLHAARVIAVSGSAEKLSKARDLGAEEGIDLSRSGLREEVRRLTGRRGADVIVEHVGLATWEQSILSLARGGRLVTCGATTGADVPLNLRHVFFKNLSILGSTMGPRGSLHAVFRHVAAGRLRAVVDRVLPLSRVREAHRLLEERGAFGKIILTP